MRATEHVWTTSTRRKAGGHPITTKPQVKNWAGRFWTPHIAGGPPGSHWVGGATVPVRQSALFTPSPPEGKELHLETRVFVMSWGCISSPGTRHGFAISNRVNMHGTDSQESLAIPRDIRDISFKSQASTVYGIISRINVFCIPQAMTRKPV